MTLEFSNSMKPIDQPFRPKWDFFVAWTLLAVATFLLTRQMEKDQGWYSYSAILILLSLFATIIIYGPVLLAVLIVRSGSRGWFVARTLISILLGVGLFGFILFATGHANNNSQMWSGLVIAVTITYLHWRIDNRNK
jgi:hypothetical protein